MSAHDKTRNRDESRSSPAFGERTRRASRLLSALALAASATAWAQSQTGNLYGKVTDDAGAPLPGVTVSLAGPGTSQNTVTSAGGEYRFLSLGPGSYAVTHTLSGFSSVKREGIVIAVNRNTELTIPMKLSSVQAELVVTVESPVLDTRKTQTGATLTKVELESIPTARDPWVVMQSVPGVLMDRVNVAGNESGQQSNMVNKGALGTQTVWNVDGVNITDMGSQSSPGYYDFDSFEEIQIGTGGSDVSVQTPGVQMNMVTKRGSNEIHGGARLLVTDERWQANNISDELAQQLLITRNVAATNQIQNLQDYGADIGGPIVKDRLWLWGSYGRNQIDLITAGGGSDKTTLENLNAKLNAQVVNGNSATVFFSRGDKQKFGRNVGPTRPPETGWNQKGPTSVYKLDDSHVFSPDLFATAFVSYVDSGFGLISVGRGQAYLDDNAIWHNGFYDVATDRPQTQASGSVSGFFRTGEMGHELKVGFSYRSTPITSTTAWVQGLFGCGTDLCTGGTSVNVTRDGVKKTDQKYYGGFVSDTLTLSSLTINAGLRYDYQIGKNKAFEVPGSRVSRDIVPSNILSGAVSVPEYDPGFRWKDFEPRIGFTYAAGADKKTLLRASYARFADQLGAVQVSFSSLAPGIAGAYYSWNDANGNGRVDAGEVDTSEILNFYGFNPDSPGSVSAPPNRVDPGLKAVKTDEVLLSLEREVLPSLAVSLSGTYRHLTDFAWSHAIGLTRNDYTEAGRLTGVLPDGTAYDVPYYGLRAGVPRPTGRVLENRPDYSQDYKGVELQITKRYAKGWMARASASFGDWKQNVGANAIVDPTNYIDLDTLSPLYLTPGFNSDGGQVVLPAGASSGAKGAVYINSKWQLNLNALYSLPLGFNVAGSFFARQGYPVPYFRSVGLSGQPPVEGLKYVVVGEVDSYRLPTVTNLDLRLEKVLKVASLEFTLGVDVFNVLNRNTALQRQNQLELGRTNFILEAQTPRVVRFGGRISF